MRWLLLLPLILAGCAVTPEQAAREQARVARDEAKLDRALAGYQAGTPVTCINPLDTHTQVFGDTILYSEGTSRYYVTRTSGGCFGLRNDDIIVTRSYSSQLCRGDIVHTIDRTSQFPSGSCTFGDFIPYKKLRG